MYVFDHSEKSKQKIMSFSPLGGAKLAKSYVFAYAFAEKKHLK